MLVLESEHRDEGWRVGTLKLVKGQKERATSRLSFTAEECFDPASCSSGLCEAGLTLARGAPTLRCNVTKKLYLRALTSVSSYESCR